MSYTDEQIDDRIRAAVNLDDDGSWRDVRRRARKRRRPLVLVGAAVLAIAAATPALAFRNDLADLWSSAEPDRNLFTRAVADCGEGTFSLEFHPQDGATVRQGEEVLASASPTERTIQCDAPIQALKGEPDANRYGGEPDKRSYAAVTLQCATDAELQIAVNPIWDTGLDGVADGAQIVGSTLLVAERGARKVFASAVLVRDQGGRTWSRVYWASGSCNAPGGYDPTLPPGVAP